jgi:DNA repair exonuclease SbcCD ATPase subunit
MNVEHNTDMNDTKTSHNNYLKQLNKTHAVEVDRLTKDREELRTTKDYKIMSLEKSMEQQRTKYEVEINKLNIIIREHEKELLNRNGKIHSLEEVLSKKTDVEAQLAEALRREKDNQAARDNLQRELEDASDYILELEEKVYKANKTSLELLKQLKDSETEIETLKQYIVDLKQRIAVYIPVKEDVVDKKLAEFINNDPERSKLKIMFMRESDGVYQFGTKRVAVKVENHNIKIRVGGGYLSIDEFLDQYTPVELEKLERKDPLKRWSEKVAVQKTIVNAGVRESSPVNQRSPGRRSPD